MLHIHNGSGPGRLFHIDVAGACTELSHDLSAVYCESSSCYESPIALRPMGGGRLFFAAADKVGVATIELQ